LLFEYVTYTYFNGEVLDLQQSVTGYNLSKNASAYFMDSPVAEKEQQAEECRVRAKCTTGTQTRASTLLFAIA